MGVRVKKCHMIMSWNDCWNRCVSVAAGKPTMNWPT